MNLTAETTKAVSGSEEQTPEEPVEAMSTTEHTDGIFFSE